MLSDPIIREILHDIISALMMIILGRVLLFLRKFQKKVAEDLQIIKTSLPPPKDEDITPIDFPRGK